MSSGKGGVRGGFAEHGGAVAVSRGVEAVERGDVGALTPCPRFLGRSLILGRLGGRMSMIMTLFAEL